MTLAEKPHVFSVTEHIIPLIKIGVAHQSKHELQHPRDCKALWKNIEEHAWPNSFSLKKSW